jgi:hypothetical protein
VETVRAAAAATAVAGSAGMKICAVEKDFDDCFERYDVTVMLSEIGPTTSVGMLSRFMIRGNAPHIMMFAPGRLPVAEIVALCLANARFQLVHDPAEVAAMMRLVMSYPNGDSELGTVTRRLASSLDRPSLHHVMGLFILGRRRASVRLASRQLGKAALRNTLRDLSLPKATSLLGWGAALHLMWQMERFDVDLHDGARAVGFSTTRQCSDVFKYHTGRAPGIALREGGFASLLEEFDARIAIAHLEAEPVHRMERCDYA